MNLERGGIPVVLNASVALAVGTSHTMDAEALSSPFRDPMVIDSIRFMARIDADGARERSLGRDVRVQFQVDGTHLSRTHVPICLYGPMLQSSGSPGETYESAPGKSGAYVGGGLPMYSAFIWKLPRPLLMLPGSALIPSLERGRNGYNQTVTAEIAYLGRRLPKLEIPRERDIPFVSAFLPAPIGFSRQVAQSGELDLANPFKAPWHVQLLTGRLFIVTSTSATDIGSASNTAPAPTTYAGSVKLSVTREGERGEPPEVRDITKGPVPFFDVFSAFRRSWRVPFTLAAKERLTAELSGFNYTAGGSDQLEPMIGVVGWRKESL